MKDADKPTILQRLETARRQGREIERLFIVNVLTATMLDTQNQQQRDGIRLARDLVRGLPMDN